MADESVEQGGVVPDRSRLEKAVSPEHTFEPHEVGTRKSRALEQDVVAEDLSRSTQRENPAGGLPFSSEHAHAVRHRADEREVVAREKDAPPACPKGFQNRHERASPLGVQSGRGLIAEQELGRLVQHALERRAPLFPFAQGAGESPGESLRVQPHLVHGAPGAPLPLFGRNALHPEKGKSGDRKSTRLNSSHSQISYAVFCLKKKR